jgi:tRNA threonylcarbamoyladenosine biosynthesis protein TsaB
VKTLGIDTATATASVALVENGKVVFDEVWPSQVQCKSHFTTGRANHAESLLPLVDSLLREAALSLSDLSGLAVSIGPGSFTGLRIGLSTVKGLAYGSKIPVVGVPTLFAVAARVSDWDGMICPVLDARKKEVYFAFFRKEAERLERVTEDFVSSPGKIIEGLQLFGKQEPCLFIGEGTKVYGDLIRSSLGDRCHLTLGESYPSTASAVARIGEDKLRKQEYDPLGSLSPLYLRPSEAELKGESANR